jgi:hypothetical protein
VLRDSINSGSGPVGPNGQVPAGRPSQFAEFMAAWLQSLAPRPSAASGTPPLNAAELPARG